MHWYRAPSTTWVTSSGTEEHAGCHCVRRIVSRFLDGIVRRDQTIQIDLSNATRFASLDEIGRRAIAIHVSATHEVLRAKRPRSVPRPPRHFIDDTARSAVGFRIRGAAGKRDCKGSENCNQLPWCASGFAIYYAM